MPNRIIREGILTSDRINKLSLEAELFYRRLMSVVDDFGRFDARPAMLRVNCYPLRVNDVTEDDVSIWLDECCGAGLIAVYVVDGKPLLELADFRQTLRARKSKYPARISDVDHPQAEGDDDDTQPTSACGADATQTRSTCVAHVSEKRRRSRSRESEAEAEKTVAAQAPPGIRPDVWQSWRKHRGRKLTDEAIRLQAVELARLQTDGYDPNEVLEQSIRNGWSGLFPIRRANGEDAHESMAKKRERTARAIFGNRRNDADAIDGSAERVP